MGTSICLLFLPKVQTDQYHSYSKAVGQEATVYPHADQKTQSKRKSYTAEKLIAPTHKNTPSHNSMRGGIFF